jgi:S-DNA-T family DNA segregation ATPase FtsK/SpoIIIE
MRIRLTVTVPGAGTTEATRDVPTAPQLHELEVEAPRASTAATLCGALAEHFGGDVDRVLSVGGDTVRPDAELGYPPLLDGASLTWGPASLKAAARPSGRPRSPVVLAVVHGPDAGRSIELTTGRITLGRSAEADVMIADPLLSRIHAEIWSDGDVVRVRDLGSTNGTRVDDVPTDPAGTPVVSGAMITMGDTRLALRGAAGVPAVSRPEPDGTRLVNRSPRGVAPPTHPAVAMPTPPVPPRRPRVPWVAVVVPLPVAVVLAAFMGPTMLAFGLMGPVLMVATVAADRVGGRRTYAADLADHERLQTLALGSVEVVCAQETRARRLALPDPATILGIATGPSARLWERSRRDADVLAVSVGTCTAPARFETIHPQSGRQPDHPLLSNVPCALPLATVGVLGICGPRAAVLGVTRSLVGQLVTLHSPLDLEVVVIAADERVGDWEWLSRVPHLRQRDGAMRPHAVAVLTRDAGRTKAAVGRLARTVAERQSARIAGGDPWPGARILVLVDGSAALRGLPDLSAVLEAGPPVGIACLALDTEAAALPSETRALLDLTNPARPSLDQPGSPHEPPADLVVDRVGSWWGDRLSRGLAPLRDATPTDEGALPTSVRLTALVPAPSADAVLRLWRRDRETTTVPVGMSRQGPWLLDLASDGPHVLVAGTTGSGKSEFLRTLVTSLALHTSPEHLSFVLVDYKGGAAFRECARLPHSAGLVTDLDDRLGRRALLSLTAELKRRERIFSSLGVSDFAAYQRLSTDDGPLPRLVIVIDEFRALAEELPDFVDGLVRIAALGRSLGVHLVLATQRPAGVVTADIKANVNLRIALRVRDTADSEDVLDAPEAARLDPTTPGRGYARAGGGPLVAVQAALASAAADPGTADGIRVRSLTWGDPPPSPEARDAPAGEGSDLGRLVDAVVGAAAAAAHPAGPRAWLPELPERVSAHELPAPDSPWQCAIGLLDRPERQEQVPLVLDLSAPGHWAFVGTSGSGRTTALMTIAAALAARLPPTRLHLYAVSGGSLAPLADLPHCGAHVDHDNLSRLDRLVDRLGDELLNRRRDPARARSHLLLLVDDWDLLATRAGSLDHGFLAERLLSLLREGAGLGLTAVIAGDRALLVGRAPSAIAHRVLLRLADRADATLAGLRAAALPVAPPPGRGVMPDSTEVQLVAGCPAEPCTERFPDGTLPFRVDALPTQVWLDELPRSASGDEVALGLGGDALVPISLGESVDGRRWLVAGPPGSGVSSALLVVTTTLLAHRRPLAVIADRAGPLDRVRDHSGVVVWCDGDSTAALVDARRRFPQLAVVVDNADGLVDSPLGAMLREVARLVDREAGLMVVGASSTVLASQYRGVAVDVARHRTGLLLRPGSVLDAELLGTRVRPDPMAPPGRGYVVRRGAAVPVQVALPGMPAHGLPGPTSQLSGPARPDRSRNLGEKDP